MRGKIMKFKIYLLYGGWQGNFIVSAKNQESAINIYNKIRSPISEIFDGIWEDKGFYSDKEGVIFNDFGDS